MNTEPILLLAGGVLTGGLSVWFVLHLRQKPSKSENGQSVVTLLGTTHDSDRSLTHRSKEPVTSPTETLILGELENPLVEITPMNFSIGNQMPIEVDSGLKIALQPLLQRSSEIFRLGEEMSKKSIRVVFSPAVTRGLSSGSLDLVETSSGRLLPVARNVSTGRFVQTGEAVAQGGVRLATVAAMSWQIVAIATAQHYLGDINERLANIERGIEDVRWWLQEEKKNELTAAINLLCQYRDAIARGPLHAGKTAAINNQFEAIERTCLAIGGLARTELQKRLKQLEHLDVREWTARGDSSERAKQWVKDNREALELVFLAQSCRLLACQVESSLPGDRHLLHRRIEQAQQEVACGVQAFSEMRQSLMDKVGQLGRRSDNPFALGGLIDEDYRPGIAQTFDNACAQASEAADNFHSQSKHALEFSTRFEQLANSGLALDVRVSEQGDIEVLAINPANS
jgi:hypothetical protein